MGMWVGCVDDWGGGGKGNNKNSYNSISSLDLSQTLRCQIQLLTDISTDWPWPLGFQRVQNWTHHLPIILPDMCLLIYSPCTSHPSQNQSHILDAFIFIHCHIYYLTDLTNFSFKIFWVDKLLFFFLLNYCPGSDLHHLCPDLSSMSCPLSHSLLYLQCKSDPALTLLQILQWVSIMLSVK